MAEQLALDVQVTSKSPLPPLPPPNDLDALRAYLAQIPSPAKSQQRVCGLPPLGIPMPPRIEEGLSEEARRATVTALMKVAYWLDTGPQSHEPPRYYAGILRGMADRIFYDVDKTFRRRPRTAEEIRSAREARDG